MVTTKRVENSRSSFYNESSVSNVGVLERTAPASYDDYMRGDVISQESFDETKARMRRNLDMLLNYDKTVEVQDVVTETQEEIQTEVQASLQDDDIRPTLTTMQFGDIDIDEVRAEMRTEEKERKQYRLSGKGKLAIVLYALTVVVILALIVINTGVLSSLNRQTIASAQTLQGYEAQYNALSTEIEHASSNSTVIDKAVNDFGMSK